MPIPKADPTFRAPITAIVNRAMELNPDQRYQSPGEMLADLKSAMRKAQRAVCAAVPTRKSRPKPTAPLSSISTPPQRTLMFVESNVQLQDIIRERLKTNGYRVLVIARSGAGAGPVCRRQQGGRLRDLFSTGELGESALDAFNRFGDGQHTGADSRRPAVGRASARLDEKGQAQQASRRDFDADQAAAVARGAGPPGSRLPERSA